MCCKTAAGKSSEKFSNIPPKDDVMTWESLFFVPKVPKDDVMTSESLFFVPKVPKDDVMTSESSDDVSLDT